MKSAFFLSKGLMCLYDKQNNTWLLLDMEFLSRVQLDISLVSYRRVKHSKRNSISTRAHVLFSISQMEVGRSRRNRRIFEARCIPPLFQQQQGSDSR